MQERSVSSSARMAPSRCPSRNEKKPSTGMNRWPAGPARSAARPPRWLRTSGSACRAARCRRRCRRPRHRKSRRSRRLLILADRGDMRLSHPILLKEFKRVFGDPKHIITLELNEELINKRGEDRCYDLDLAFHATRNRDGKDVALIYKPCIAENPTAPRMGRQHVLDTLRRLRSDVIDIRRRGPTQSRHQLPVRPRRLGTPALSQQGHQRQAALRSGGARPHTGIPGVGEGTGEQICPFSVWSPLPHCEPAASAVRDRADRRQE